MATALLHPQRVERLLVLDMAPVTYDAAEPQWGAIGAVVQAMRTVRLPTIRGKRDADQLLSRVVSDPGLRSFVLMNLVRGRSSGASGAGAAGGSEGAGFRWRVNLPAIEAALPALGGWDLGGAGDDAVYSGNTLFVGGGKSRFLRSSHLPAIQRHFTRFSLSTIRSADHWIHADEPEALLLITTRFMAVPAADPADATPEK
jgi:esterase